MSAFQRENPSHYPWEREIVISTILCTIHYGFPQLLPLYFQILERLIVQTLTTPILSVKWGFSAARKHWKKPFVWWMQSGWIVWSGELQKIRFRYHTHPKSVGNRSLEGSSTWDRLRLKGFLLFVYSKLFSCRSIYCLEGSGEVFHRVLRFPLR